MAAIPTLQSLKLDYTAVTDKGLEPLKQLPKLTELSLDNTNITDAAVEILRTLNSLRSLDLYHTRISKTGYETLRSALPRCRIVYDEPSGQPPRRAPRT